MALVNNGDYQDFNYTGDIQSITLTKSGVYKLECWGAGTSAEDRYSFASAKGGYVSGHKFLNAGDTLYIVVGGSNGYNGGGSSTSYQDPVYAYFSCSSGGGATHIASKSGLLTSFLVSGSTTNETFTTEDGYLIAGGAGGSVVYQIANGDTGGRDGGAGGTGGNNGKFGIGSSHPGSGSHDYDHGCGGGAGYRGGSYSNNSASQINSGGSGGTNWNGGCPTFTYNGTTYSPSSSSGVRNGDGLARVTLTEVAYTITVSKNIDSNLLSVSGAGDYPANTSATITASITDQEFGGKHYRFAGWYSRNTLISTSLSYTFTISASVSYEARFVEQANVVVSSNPNGAGVISNAGIYDIGTSVSLSATPNNGFAFVDWAIDEEHYTSNPLSITITEDTSVSANFTSAYNINTRIIGEGNLNTNYTTSGITIEAVPATHWGFSIIKVSFLDNLETADGLYLETANGEEIMIVSSESSYNTNPITISISNDIEIEVTFVYVGKQFTRYIYGIGGQNDETSRGNILGSDPSGIYDSGTTVTVEVGSNGLYHTFVGWYPSEDDAKADQNRVSSSQIYSFTITDDTTLVAKFVFNYPWIPVIKDRTINDITNKTAKAYLNYTDILRLEKDLGYMEGYYNLPIQVDLNWDYTRYIYESDFTRLRNRLAALKQISGVTTSVPIHPINVYSRMNTFEKTLDNVHNTIV